MIGDFHFIRPLWLLALLPAAAIIVALWRRSDGGRAWRNVIAPHLLPNLIERPQHETALRPHFVLTLLLPIALLALAGPSWKREPSPFVEDSAALVIALEVTPTMLAEDIQPSRLGRAVQKIGDLLKLRKGAPASLLAYAGSAHMVMPLTSDADVIASFATELSPDLMPVEGDSPSAAIELAMRQISGKGSGGSILLITDSVPAAEIERIAKARAAGAPKVHLFGIAAGPEVTPPPGSPAAPALDQDSLEAAARAGGGKLVLVTPDDSDIRRLARTVETDFTPASDQSADGARWRDAGYWLVPFVALGCLLWFRPGWTIRWSAAAGLVLLLNLSAIPDALADDDAKTSTWFKTREQLAQQHFDAGEFAAAAKLFIVPLRQGTAWYRAGEFKRAAAAFGRSESAEAYFNRGNALIMQGLYSAAIGSYDQALALKPDWAAAITNREVADLRAKSLQITAEDGEGTGGKLGADEIVFDLEKHKGGDGGDEEIVAGAGDQLGDDELRGLWLRRVETKPADFLRSKFRFQQMQSEIKKGEK